MLHILFLSDLIARVYEQTAVSIKGYVFLAAPLCVQSIPLIYEFKVK